MADKIQKRGKHMGKDTLIS